MEYNCKECRNPYLVINDAKDYDRLCPWCIMKYANKIKRIDLESLK